MNANGWNNVHETDAIATAIDAGDLRRAGSVLAAGPTEDVLRGVPTGLLNVAAGDGDGLVVVTTGAAPRTLLERVDREVDGISRDRVAVVDARPNGDQVRSNPSPLHWRVRSPMDLTGTGTAVHECLDALFERGVSTRHVWFDSLARLVLGGDVQTVARFTHQLVVLAQAPDAVSVYAVQTNAIDDDRLAALAHCFGGRVDARQHAGARQLRARGLPAAPDDWVELGESEPDRIGDVRIR